MTFSYVKFLMSKSGKCLIIVQILISNTNLSISYFSQDLPKKTAPVVKTEMQTLRLSDTSQKLVMDTLKHIHGAVILCNIYTPYFILSNRK